MNAYDLRFYSRENATNKPKLVVTWSNTPKTVYFLKDHLGSVRATVDQTGAVVGYDDYDAWGYALGGRTKKTPWDSLQAVAKNKFTGKERDDNFGINWEYFGARYYDAQIGRWMSVDPLAEKHPNFSPYNYVLNNPLRFIDPDGKQVDIHDVRLLRDQALRQAGTTAQEINELHKADLRADLIGTGILAGGLAAFAAMEAVPYLLGAALSNPVATNQIGIAITDALAPGAENLGAASAIKGLTKGDLQRVLIGGESKAGRFSEALHNKPLAEGGSKVESLKSMGDGKFVFVKKLEDGSYEITVQTRVRGKTTDTQITRGKAKDLGLPNLDELYEQGAANHFIGKTKEE